MTCKQACRFGTPARIFDGPVMHDVSAVRLAAKRAAKGSPERDRLQRLIDTQARLCWSCGKRCSEGEAAQLSHEAVGAPCDGLKA
jgi:hypothetical protein